MALENMSGKEGGKESVRGYVWPILKTPLKMQMDTVKCLLHIHLANGSSEQI